MNVSVCLASYNGGKFIEQQLKSILNQLSLDDEVIIVDDCSTDNTIELINSFNDKRIILFKNEINKGHVFSFGLAIEKSSKDIIFMSDQDDVWTENRLQIMSDKLLSSDAILISSNSEFIDCNGAKIDFKIAGLDFKSSKKYFKNILDVFVGKENYYGCLMAFKKDLKRVILPFPKYVESHDLWIAMAANILKSNLHCIDITLLRRIHGSNVSVNSRNLLKKLWSRFIFLRSILHLYFRKHTLKNTLESK